MFTKQVSRSMDSPDPTMAAEAQQVEQLEEDLVMGPIRGFCALQPHRGIDLRTPTGNSRPPVDDLRAARVHRRDVLGGLIHEYQAAA
jgi:hypothetical protein